jgi:ketosteroid isomerase-like protein
LKRQTVTGDSADVRLEWLAKTSQKSSGKMQDGRTVLDVTLKREDGHWKIAEIKPAS